MRLTAVEWLGLYIKSITDLNCDEIIDQAKEMERGHAQLYAIYCLTSIKEDLPVIRFEDFIKLEGGDK
jgi:hypothetical protein